MTIEEKKKYYDEVCDAVRDKDVFERIESNAHNLFGGLGLDDISHNYRANQIADRAIEIVLEKLYNTVRPEGLWKVSTSIDDVRAQRDALVDALLLITKSHSGLLSEGEAMSQGRPKHSPEQKRTPTPVRLTEEERELLNEVAHHAGLELSTYMRVVSIEAAREAKRAREEGE
jgi:hypothetical protein